MQNKQGRNSAIQISEKNLEKSDKSGTLNKVYNHNSNISKVNHLKPFGQQAKLLTDSKLGTTQRKAFKSADNCHVLNLNITLNNYKTAAT